MKKNFSANWDETASNAITDKTRTKLNLNKKYINEKKNQIKSTKSNHILPWYSISIVLTSNKNIHLIRHSTKSCVLLLWTLSLSHEPLWTSSFFKIICTFNQIQHIVQNHFSRMYKAHVKHTAIEQLNYVNKNVYAV